MSQPLSLYHHPRGYNLTFCEALCSPLVMPFAKRHLVASFNPQFNTAQRWGHRLIATIEYIPVVGLLAALIESIVVLAIDFFQGVAPAAAPSPAAPSIDTSDDSSVSQSIVPQTPKSIVRFHWKLLIEKVIKAQQLVAFCEHLPVKKVLFASEDPLEKARELREWLSTDDKIAQMKNLDLTNKQLKVVPPEIRHFKALTNLKLGRNQLKRLPAAICTLFELRLLNLMHNRLSELPANIGNLTKLRTLGAEHNQLKGLPKSIVKLVELQDLYLQHNYISALPEDIDEMEALQTLVLDKNDLMALPKSMGNLKNLSMLKVEGNILESVPEELGKLRGSLNELDLRNNNLSSLPNSIADIRESCELNINGNPMNYKDLPIAIRKHPSSDFQAALEAPPARRKLSRQLREE